MTAGADVHRFGGCQQWVDSGLVTYASFRPFAAVRDVCETRGDSFIANELERVFGELDKLMLQASFAELDFYLGVPFLIGVHPTRMNILVAKAPAHPKN